MDVGNAHVTSAEALRDAGAVDARETKDGRVQIVDLDLVHGTLRRPEQRFAANDRSGYIE